MELGKVEVKLLEDTIGLQGEVKFFLLYESEGEVAKIKSYETTIPFSGNVECHGCRGQMIGDIMPVVTHQNISVKEDYDGEDRVLELEMVLELPMQIYENKMVEQITDLYGISQEAVPEYRVQTCKRIMDPVKSRYKITQEVKTKNTDKKVLQICHVHCHPSVEAINPKEQGVEIEGILQVAVLYLEDGEEESYGSVKKEIPYCAFVESGSMGSQNSIKARTYVEGLDSVILDEYSIELKIVLGMEILAEEVCITNKIGDVVMNPYSKESMERRAGIAVYIPGKKENLWEIGKKYGIALNTIAKVNDWTEHSGGEWWEKEVEAGQKLLLVREEI